MTLADLLARDCGSHAIVFYTNCHPWQRYQSTSMAGSIAGRMGFVKRGFADNPPPRLSQGRLDSVFPGIFSASASHGDEPPRYSYEAPSRGLRVALS